MKTFELTIKGAKEFRMAVKNYPHIAGPVIAKAIAAVPAVLAKHTLRDNPVPFRTGNLLQSFRQRVTTTQATWYPTANYAAMVEYGTRPHLIMPRTRMALRWRSGGQQAQYVTSASGRRYYKSGNPEFAFAKLVKHPGSKPHPYMQKILDNSRTEILALFDQAGGIITRNIAAQMA